MLRHHWQLAIVLALFVCLTTVFSLVLPLGEADDETDHFALVRFIAENGRPPMTIAERHAIGAKGDASPIYHALVALLIQHVDVSSLPDLPATQTNPLRLIPSDGFQGDRILHTEDELLPWRGIVRAWHLARLLSVPLGVATVVAAYCTARRLWPQRQWLAAGVAGCVAFLPRLAVSGGVVNDDALALPLAAWALYGMVRVAQGDRRRATCLWLGAVIGLAAITKYFNLVLVPEVGVLVVVSAWLGAHRSPDDGTAPSAAVKTAACRLGWLTLAFGATAGWYFAWLWVNFNQVTELGWWRGLLAPLGDPVLTSGLGPATAVSDSGALGGWAWLEMLFRSFWLSYGWQHLFAPGWVNGVLAILCGLAGIGWLAALGRQRRGAVERVRDDTAMPMPATMRQQMLGVDRTVLLVLLMHTVLVILIVALRGWLKPSPETAQGRHLYPAIVPLSVFLVSGLDRLGGIIAWRGRGGKPASLGTEAPRLALIGVVPVVLLALAVATWPLILTPHYLPYLPICRTPVEQTQSQPLPQMILPAGVSLVGLDMSVAEGACGISTAQHSGKHLPHAGNGLTVTRTWYAATGQPRDYLIRMCLADVFDRIVICHYSQPVDGRYPMRAWEAGYTIRDTAELPLPACLPAGTYSVRLAVLPLRLDTPLIETDATAPLPDETTLGHVCVQPRPAWNASLDSFDVWTAEGKVSTGRLNLHRLRQSVTLVAIRTLSDSVASGPSGVALVPDSSPPYAHDLPDKWLPVSPPTEYHCPNGAVVAGYSFVLHPAVAPGLYRPVGDTLPHHDVAVNVDVRWRNYTPPPTVSAGLAAPAAFVGANTDKAQLALLNYDVDRAASEPGASISVTSYWQARLTMHRPAVVSLYLLDPLGGVGGQVDRSLGGHYPNVLWAPGEVVAETYQLPVRAEAPAGLYTVQLGLYHYDPPERGRSAVPQYMGVRAGASDVTVTHLDLGRVRVKDYAEGTSPSVAVGVDLGGMLSLIGYDLTPPAGTTLGMGQTLNLVLHWRATRRPSQDYTVFTQLVGPDGRVYGQQDNQPQGGRYPTTAWELDRPVIDRYDLRVQDGAPKGAYRLLVGMYDLATGTRLPAMRDDGTRLPDDAIELATVVVE